MPTKHLIIRRLTCISPYSAAIAIGKEMSGGIEDVRAEDTVAVNTESAVRIKTAVVRGMKWVFWITGNYGSHVDNHYDPNALPEIKGINYRAVAVENVSMAGRLEGIAGDPFTGICMSKKAKKYPWSCSLKGWGSVIFRRRVWRKLVLSISDTREEFFFQVKLEMISA